MAAPSYVGSGASAHSTTTPKTVACGTRAVGDLVVVVVLQVSGGTNTYSVSDNLGNSYALAAQDTSDTRRTAIYYAVVTSGGSLTVSVGAAGGIAYSIAAVWASPPGGTTIAFDAAGNFGSASNNTSHPCAAVGQIDTAADVFAVAGSVTGGSTGTVTDPTGFTLRQQPLSQRAFMWSKESAAALTDERAQWVSGSSCSWAGAVASFKAVAAGGGGGSALMSDWW